MLRAIASAICTVILIIVLFFVVRWGLDAYRVSTTDNTVAMVCDTSHDHVFTSEGVLDIHDSNGHNLQPGQTYSFYTQKRFPWEYPTIIAAQPADMSTSGPTGSYSGACGTAPGGPPAPTEQQPGYNNPPVPTDQPGYNNPPAPMNQPGYNGPPPPVDQPGYNPPPPIDQPDNGPPPPVDQPGYNPPVPMGPPTY